MENLVRAGQNALSRQMRRCYGAAQSMSISFGISKLEHIARILRIVMPTKIEARIATKGRVSFSQAIAKKLLIALPSRVAWSGPFH
jgi:hypothetical protein